MRLNKKYVLTLTAVAALSTTALVGCSSKEANTEGATVTPVVTEAPTATETPAPEENTANEEVAGTYVDGTYTKVADEAENGYTYEVTMTVENGAITSMNWDAKDENGQSKKELAENGSYVMTEDGLLWSEQSDALCAFVVENQSLEGLTTIDEEGHTDVVAGVSIKITPFLTLAQACIDEASSKTATEDTAAMYVDGTYTKVADEAENGYTYEVTMTVENGAIASMIWDAKDENGQSKKELAENGSYVMTENGLLWSAQSEALCAYVVENQSLEGLTTIDEDGHTDVVAGVSIKINPFLTLAQGCIDEATAK